MDSAAAPVVSSWLRVIAPRCAHRPEPHLTALQRPVSWG